jgi:hypothetical protein
MVPFADAADRPSRLGEVAVEQMTGRPPSDYREASALAARGSAPLEVALGVTTHAWSHCRDPTERQLDVAVNVSQGVESTAVLRRRIRSDVAAGVQTPGDP